MKLPATDTKIAEAIATLTPGTLITAVVWVPVDDDRDPDLPTRHWEQQPDHLMMVTGSPFEDKRMLVDANGDADYAENMGVVSYQLSWLPGTDIRSIVKTAVDSIPLPTIDRVVLDGADEMRLQRYGRAVGERVAYALTGRNS